MNPARTVPLRFAYALGALAFALVASACGNGTQGGSCTSSSSCPSGQSCVNSMCVPGNGDGGGIDGTGLDGSNRDGSASEGGRDGSNGDGRNGDGANTDGSAGGCTASTQCDGGVCAGGTCCAVANVCGDSCCSGAQVCLANACVTPGANCRTTVDCPSGSYCETSLGGSAGGDAGADSGSGPGDGGRVCSAPTPAPGRCIQLPPTCPSAGDGGTVADAGTCIQHCEYHPSAGQLDAVEGWGWGVEAPPADLPNYIDVWSTPVVGRVYDANCDGALDNLDPPAVLFVSGKAIDVNTGLGACCQCTNTTPTGCHTGVLRALDGRTGAALWSLRAPSDTSEGFAGTSVALGDVDGDRRMDVVAMSGEGYLVLVDGSGVVKRIADMPVPGANGGTFGWGGGIAIADADGDGAPELAYGAALFHTTNNAITRAWVGRSGTGGPGAHEVLSTFADMDGAADGNLELVAGNTVYKVDGSTLWDRTDLGDGFPAVADMNGDGTPEEVMVVSGTVLILNGATGATLLGPVTLPGTGSGGPPTIADFDGDHRPEIGVAQQNFYSVLKPDFTANTIAVLWSTPNHDLSSSVTGSTVFDFEGDGRAEVIYADECFLWVFDGQTGAIRYAGLTTSFTGTEASIVADVDGDGHAEIVNVSNGADPSANGWKCDIAPWNQPDPTSGRPAWVPPAGSPAYRGIRVFRDSARSWVGTRSIWNQHTYHVTNVCVPEDDGCMPRGYEGQIPRRERSNWGLSWLNNFRQNVQQSGLFAAPDATITLSVDCTFPPRLTASVRNLGEALLPPGVVVGFFVQGDGGEMQIGTATTTASLFPGGVAQVSVDAPGNGDPLHDVFVARILNDPANPTFRECNANNDESAPAMAVCPPG